MTMTKAKAMKGTIQRELDSLYESLEGAKDVLCDREVFDVFGLLRQLEAARSPDAIARVRDEIETVVGLASDALDRANGHHAEIDDLLTGRAEPGVATA
jgi:hypothetical protein